MCDAIEITISNLVDDTDPDNLVEISDHAITHYNGVYTKQLSKINGLNWWVARDDVGATAQATNTTLYYSTSHNRWILEAPDVYWEANQTSHSFTHDNPHRDLNNLNEANDQRRFQGLDESVVLA